MEGRKLLGTARDDLQHVSAFRIAAVSAPLFVPRIMKWARNRFPDFGRWNGPGTISGDLVCCIAILSSFVDRQLPSVQSGAKSLETLKPQKLFFGLFRDARLK